MARYWEAHTTSPSIEIGTIFELNEGPSSSPPEPLVTYGGFDLVTGDGGVHKGIIAASLPGNIVVRLADVTVYLLPAAAGSWLAPASTDRRSGWAIDRIETNLHRDDDPPADVTPEIAETEAANHDFVEGQLPGMPVSHDPLREPGPTPGQVGKTPQD